MQLIMLLLFLLLSQAKVKVTSSPWPKTGFRENRYFTRSVCVVNESTRYRSHHLKPQSRWLIEVRQHFFQRCTYCLIFLLVSASHHLFTPTMVYILLSIILSWQSLPSLSCFTTGAYNQGAKIQKYNKAFISLERCNNVQFESKSSKMQSGRTGLRK